LAPMLLPMGTEAPLNPPDKKGRELLPPKAGWPIVGKGSCATPVLQMLSNATMVITTLNREILSMLHTI